MARKRSRAASSDGGGRLMPSSGLYRRTSCEFWAVRLTRATTSFTTVWTLVGIGVKDPSHGDRDKFAVYKTEEGMSPAAAALEAGGCVSGPS